MEKMVIDNHKQTIAVLLREGEDLLQRCGDEESVKKLQTTRQETEEKKEPVIMFYGLYNAGKSTLGNALCGANLKTGDVPTTASIEKIHWAGYTLIDTPGINAHAEHTEIAEAEIRQSDVILFVMDNADTFDTERVYEAIVKILKMGKPLAIVINQKNVDTDEDANIPVPARASILNIAGKVSSNLSQYAARCGIQLERDACFLGIYPLNARNALKARGKAGAGAERILERTGVASLRNALNLTIRRSEVAYMLRTPLINLRDTLRQAMERYQTASIYGEKQDLAKNRESLLASRQRLRDRLLNDGLRKIDTILEEVKAAAANGQTVEGVDKRISETLNELLKDVAAQESLVLQKEIKVEAMPDYQAEHSGGSAQSGQNNETPIIGDLAQIASFFVDIMHFPIPLPVPIPISVITAAVRLVWNLLFPKSEDDSAARSQEQLANYYRWQNELRDQEIKIKAAYEKSVNDFLTQFYDPQLEKIDQALAEVDSGCAEHTKNLRAMEQLMLRVGDEMMSLSTAG